LASLQRWQLCSDLLSSRRDMIMKLGS